MSGWTKARDRILENRRPGTHVLVVEGEDDKAFFEALLNRVAPGSWPSGWMIGVAGGKASVPPLLNDQPGWQAVVDRDEWSAADIRTKQNEFPGRLHVLPRYCMESYFVVPAEIWDALPTRQDELRGGRSSLEQGVLSNLHEWLRHGCLWHAVNPLQDGLRALGFKDALLNPAAAQDDAKIRQTLRNWHNLLDPEKVEAEFHENLAIARQAGVEEQLTRWVHGKKFFEQHVVRVLNGLLEQHSPDKWLKEMSKDLPPPPDLAFLWAAMGLQPHQ